MGVRVSYNATQPKSSDPQTQPNSAMNNDPVDDQTLGR